MQTWIALVAAFAALLGVVANFIKTRRDFEQWEKEQTTQLEVSFLHTLVDRRLLCYPPVFKLLGEVRDADLRDSDHLDAVEQSPGRLVEVAEDLRAHVYGEAGLVMSMETRDVLLELVDACYGFDSAEVSLGLVRSKFFMARRLIRADLQLEDIDEVSSELKAKVDRLKGERPEPGA